MLGWGAWSALALVLTLAAWVLFLPVPLAWAARAGLARSLPAGSPLRVEVEAVTFRWRWGDPSLAIEIRGLDATAQGRPLARWRELIVEMPKAGLWRREFAPERILVRAPFLTLDQTEAGALALLATPKNTATSSTPLDLAAFAPVLPAPGAQTLLVVEGAAVSLRNAAGETRLSFGEIRTTLTRRPDGPLGFELDLPLAEAKTAPRLTARATLDPQSQRGTFSLGLPSFSTKALPTVPGAPPLPFRGIVSFDASGRFNLAKMSVEEAAGGVIITDADVALPPDLAAGEIRVDRLELRGRFDGLTQRVVLETGRVRTGALELNVAELDAALGDRPSGRVRLEITGLQGRELRRLVTPAQRARITLPDEAIDAIALERLTLSGRAEFAQGATGAWAAQGMQFESRAEIGLGGEPLVCTVSANQPGQGADIQLEVVLPSFVPGRWPAALIAGTPADAIAVPLSFSAQATVSATGEPRAARGALTGAAGTVKSLRPGLPSLEVRRIEVRAESDRFDQAWRLPIARLELANGAALELARGRAELMPARIAAEGELRATKLTGDFLALWLPADAWAPLTARNLPPPEVALEEFVLRFKAAAAAEAGGAWQPQSLAADASAQVRLHAARLSLTTSVKLPEAGRQLEANLALEEFRPAQLGLLIADGLSTDAIDFPVSLRATARAGLDGQLTAASLQLRAGAGRLKTPPALGGLDVPFKGLALEAGYDPGRGRAEVKSLRLAAGGLQLDLADVTATTAPPHAVAGKLELAPFALRPLLSLWPAHVQPELRRTVESALLGGDFLGARFDYAMKLDPAAQPAVSVAQLKGEAVLAALDVAHAAVPGPITVGRVTVAVDFPRATLALQDIALPGARIAMAQAQLAGLDRPLPTASIAASFESDLVAANRAWKFDPENYATGTISGEITGQAPFSLETVASRVVLDFKRARVKLPGLVHATPDTLAIDLSATHPLASDRPMTANFALETSPWLGAPVRLAGRATLGAGDRQPVAIELARYEHGRTRLQASFRQPTPTHREISVTGAHLNLAPLLRAGLAAADALSARTAAPDSPAAANAPAAPPATMKIDASIAEIEFGPGQSARRFELHTRIDRNWPADFTLGALAGADDALNVSLTGPGEHQVFKFSIGDASVWMRTLAAPWSELPPAPGQFGSLVLQLAKVPTMLAGGAVALEADVRRGEPEWLIGKLRLQRAVLIRSPYVLQLLALKSGRSLQNSPTIEDFSIARLTLSRSSVSITDMTLAGSGLIDRIKLKSASYGLADEALKVDGEYFGVGFDIVGTRADPKIFLKDSNPLIRAVGVRNEFDFDVPAPKSPRPPP